MVHRKAPSLEEARELFLEDPNKMLQQWADEWGVTHERVRQLRIESGVPQRGAYNEETAESILEIIRTQSVHLQGASGFSLRLALLKFVRG